MGGMHGRRGRDWLFLAKQPASAPHMLRIVPHTVPRVGRSYEHVPDRLELPLLPKEGAGEGGGRGGRERAIGKPHTRSER